MTYETRWTQLIFIEHSIKKQQNTHSSQVHMEHSPGQITSLDKNLGLVQCEKIAIKFFFFKPQLYKTRNQPQEKESTKKKKKMETKKNINKKQINK